MISISDIQQRYTAEIALCVLACRACLDNAIQHQLRSFIENTEIDWTRFSEIIKTLKLKPIVAKVFIGVADILPTTYADQLQKSTMAQSAQLMQRTAEVINIHNKLKDAGIENIPYKGVILSQQLFGDNISRQSSDMDFLINPRDFAKAKSILETEGYVADYYNPAYEKFILNTSHELILRKRKGNIGLNFELHWAITNKMLDIPITNKEVMNEKMVCRIGGVEIETFSLQNHFMVILIHHGVNDIWRSMRHAMDVALFIQLHGKFIDWEKLCANALKHKIHYTTSIGIQLAHELFGTSVPAQFSKKPAGIGVILHNMLRYPPIVKGKLKTDNIKQQLALRDSTMDKLRVIWAYVRTGITPNIRDMEAIHLPGILYPLYYIIKPFRIFVKKVTITKV